MTDNRSVIVQIAMINFGANRLKFRRGWSLTSGRALSAREPRRVANAAADIRSSIRDRDAASSNEPRKTFADYPRIDFISYFAVPAPFNRRISMRAMRDIPAAADAFARALSHPPIHSGDETVNRAAAVCMRTCTL
ncbi:hypothetical protein KDW49_16785 [Burkholderia dolosa]|uniref:hypothetical protein n=1 Tax=Burkholderia dolosa TaxID=152500 RepID=UPI001B90011A|nr:hypothetical protein [Burkholderia dolosa]MBR8302365.1 hypothetical protein [Burkholderia dolosa]